MHLRDTTGNGDSPVTPDAFRRTPGAELLSKAVGAGLVGCVETYDSMQTQPRAERLLRSI